MVIRNSLKGQMLDAGRRFCKEYEPPNEQSNLQLLKLVQQLKQQSLEHLRTAIDHIYCSRTSDVLSVPVSRLTLQSMAPQSRQEHLEFHSNRLSTYWLAKEEIEPYLDIKVPARSNQARVHVVNCLVLNLVSTRFGEHCFPRFPVPLLLPWCSMLATVGHTVSCLGN